MHRNFSPCILDRLPFSCFSCFLFMKFVTYPVGPRKSHGFQLWQLFILCVKCVRVRVSRLSSSRLQCHWVGSLTKPSSDQIRHLFTRSAGCANRNAVDALSGQRINPALKSYGHCLDVARGWALTDLQLRHRHCRRVFSKSLSMLSSSITWSS